MRKRLLIILAVLVVLGITALVVLRSHAVEIVNAVVLHAVIQKAPDDYPADRIREAFDSSLQAAQQNGTTDQYLDHLKALSQRIEKVQRLDGEAVDKMIEQLKP
jgi:hypothetical protein